MPFMVTSGKLDVTFFCSVCGESETVATEDITEYVGNAFTVDSFECPKCGADLVHDTDGFGDWDEPNREEYESVGKDFGDEDENSEDDEDEDNEDK